MLKFTPFPTIVHYSDNVPEGVGGYAKMCYVRIRPKYKGTDVGIHKHEDLHVTQWYILFLGWVALCVGVAGMLGDPYYVIALAFIPWGAAIHPALYWLVKEYKLASEVEAYKEQAKHYEDDRLPKFAGYISRDYGLNITEEAALELLRET